MWSQDFSNDVWPKCKTQQEVCKLPAGRSTIDCKWVFKPKENFDGSIARYKATLVAKGYSQKEGFDFDETYSPVVSHESLVYCLPMEIRKTWTSIRWM